MVSGRQHDMELHEKKRISHCTSRSPRGCAPRDDMVMFGWFLWFGQAVIQPGREGHAPL